MLRKSCNGYPLVLSSPSCLEFRSNSETSRGISLETKDQPHAKDHIESCLFTFYKTMLRVLYFSLSKMHLTIRCTWFLDVLLFCTQAPFTPLDVHLGRKSASSGTKNMVNIRRHLI